MDKARFAALWARCLRDGTATDGAAVFDRLLARYSEAHRCYHTPHHIDHCLKHFDMAADLMKDRDAVEMALWFHDAIYDVPTAGNERRSAELFVDAAGERVGPEFRREVYDMIMATCHEQPPKRHDHKFLVDVDLSSFGLPWEEFRQDSENVRGEFPQRSDEDFYTAHIKFMQSLIDRPSFFSTEFFRNKYEKTARENVRRLIAELRESGF